MCGQHYGHLDICKQRQKLPAKKLTILPFPSSPHCSPKIAVFEKVIFIYST